VFLAWTAVQNPHAALGAELTDDHHERTSLFAVRDGLWILGTLVAAASPALARQALGGTEGHEREVFAALALTFGFLLVVLPWVCILGVREPAVTSAPTAATPLQATREAWRNRPFRVMLLAYGIGALGGALPATLVLFYVEHVLHAARLGELFLAAYFLVGVVCLPLWTRAARRIGKKPAWLLAMALSVAAFSGAFFLGPGDTAWYGAIVVVSGIGFGAGLVLPASLVADTIDYDEWETGHRREGLYYGLWSIVTKVSAALGAATALPLLEWAGYAAQATTQPESVSLALRTMYAAVPCLCYAAAFVVAVRFPIDERRHSEIRRALDARAAATAGAAPAPSLGGASW
jgi:GPH family glycoside/pentoside/hexuronide:cation symporter